MRTFIDGRNGKDGLAAFGFDCTIFPDGNQTLRERIDRFGMFLDRLHAREPDAFPVATRRLQRGRAHQPRLSESLSAARERDRRDAFRSRRRTAG